MIKKKLLSVAAATLAACSIGATAFAAGVYPFAGTIIENQTLQTIQPRIKNDDLYAVVYIDEGLESGTTYLKFSVIDYASGVDASIEEEELWVNGRCPMDYKNGYGIIGKEYILRIKMPPQANAHTIGFKGTWTP